MNTLNDLYVTHATGLVQFFEKTPSGAFIFAGEKNVEFRILEHKGINFSFAEGIRSSCFNARISKTEVKYDFKGTTAYCQLIKANSGAIINKIPLMISDWENYGVQK